MDGLIHVIEKPKDMITARIHPEPMTRVENTINKAEELFKKIEERLNKI